MKIAAIDIGGTEIKYAWFSEYGDILLQGIIPTGLISSGIQLVKKVSDIIRDMGSFDLIGVSTAGQINPITGTVIYANEIIKGYTGTNVKSMLENTFKVPVTVDNDVNNAAIGEAHFGSGKNFYNFLCITYGTGVGGAIILNREIYYGHLFSAGEFGHIITHVNGIICNCGNRGCYESYASVSALLKVVLIRTGKNLNGKELFEYITSGKSLYKEILDEWIEEVMAGLASLIHIFNPECIILGGGIMKENYVISRIQERIPQILMSNYREVQILKAGLGNNASLYGALFKSLKGERSNC